MPHRQWTALNVRQAAFNPVQVSPHVLSAHPAIFRAHPTRLAAFAPKEALLPRMGRRMKRSVPRANSSIKLNQFVRSVRWANSLTNLVRANVKMRLWATTLSELEVLTKSPAHLASMPQITRAHFALWAIFSHL